LQAKVTFLVLSSSESCTKRHQNAPKYIKSALECIENAPKLYQNQLKPQKSGWPGPAGPALSVLEVAWTIPGTKIRV